MSHPKNKGKPLQALTANIIKQSFKTTQRQGLAIPKLEQVDWGVLDYFGWIHPAGHAGFVVALIDGEAHGLRLRRMLNTTTRPRTHMCSWCHHVYRARGTAMFSAEVIGSEGRRRVGNYICRDLDCSVRIRNLTGDPPTYLPETIDLPRKVARLELSVAQFFTRVNAIPSLY